MLSLPRTVGLLQRPHVITPDAAAAWLPRLIGFDPRVARHSQPLELMTRLTAARPVVMDDDEEEDRPRNPTRPVAYTPRWLGEPDAVGETGWVLKSGVGVMCIDTPLVDRGFGVCGVWFHGYDTIEAAMREMDGDDRVKAIFLKWDSPGGVVAPGLYDLTAYMQARGPEAKPMWSYADLACSGAYWLSSQSARLISHEAGFTGSIGAVYTHASYAGYLDKNGIVITPVQFGAHKTDAADFKPLDDAAKAEIQADIDQIGEDFLAAVANGRGARFSADQARATEARVFAGRHVDKTRDALALGLVDAVMPEPEAFAALLAEVKALPAIQIRPAASAVGRTAGTAGSTAAPAASTETTMKTREQRIAAVMAGKTSAKTADEKLDEIRKIMDEEEDPAAEGEEEEDPAAEGEEEEDPAAEGEEEEEPEASGPKGAKPAAALTGKGRIKAILALPEAKGREALAQEIALETDLTVTQAKGMLAKSPKTSALAAKVTDPGLSSMSGKKPSKASAEAMEALSHAGLPTE
jgi:ClpP class serine protease